MTDLEKDALKFLEDFKETLIQAAKEAVGNAYCDILPHIETDAWINYRESIKSEMKGGIYGKAADTVDGHWAKEVRKMILKEHREELVGDLNKDLLEKVDSLREQLTEAYKVKW